MFREAETADIMEEEAMAEAEEEEAAMEVVVEDVRLL